MARTSCSFLSAVVVGCFMFGLLFIPAVVSAHCDTYGGPVILAAKQALEKGDVTPLLKWVKKADEEQVKSAFKKALVVRAKGMEAKELADEYFFETIVRLHRIGEGANYTGLKSGPMEPIEAMADQALATGNIDSLTAKIAAHVKQGIKDRFAKVVEAKKSADKSVEAGREFVEAYIIYLHYVTGIHSIVMGKSGHAEEAGAAECKQVK